MGIVKTAAWFLSSTLVRGFLLLIAEQVHDEKWALQAGKNKHTPKK